MRVIYSGVDLMPIETHEYVYQAVYDDTMTDYLFTRVTLLVTALVNGLTTIDNGPFMSYDFKGGESGAVPGPKRAVTTPTTPDANQSVPPSKGIERGLPNKELRGIRFQPSRPTWTHETVRHRLETPRGQLYVFTGPGMESGVPEPGTTLPPPRPDDINLRSPDAGKVCDCKNGPFPKLFGVTMATGDANTLVVDWGCETFINEAAKNNVSPMGGLLSNRFKQIHSVDDDGYTTLVVEGTAIFRTDFVYSENRNPDTDRAILFMPIPQGFRRVIDYVDPMPDVTGIKYQYRDTQVPVNFVAGPYAKASHIAAVHRQAVSVNADLIGGALSVYDRILNTAVQRRFASDPNQGPVPQQRQQKKSKRKRKGTP